jgi:hypothetical protein
MSLAETLEASGVLRRFTACFESCIKKGKEIEARTYLPNIRKACELLNMDWRAVLGIENERFFTDNEPFISVQEPIFNRSVAVQVADKNPQIAVQKDIIRSSDNKTGNCVVCGKSLNGKRSDAKFCSGNCRNSNRKCQ